MALIRKAFFKSAGICALAPLTGLSASAVPPKITRATAHLCAAIPNLFRQEYPSTAREDRGDAELLDPPTEVHNGEMMLTGRPGLGSKINEKLLASRRVA